MVANIQGDAVDTAPSLASLERELSDRDQVVWVDAAGRSAALGRPALTNLEAPPGSSRGGLYRRGLDESHHDVVAFTDSATVLLAGWRAAALDGLVGRGVAGGPVLPPKGRVPVRCVAGFLVEYGVHAVPPFTSAAGDVSANNVVYDRSLLESVLNPSEPVWKSEVNRRLARRGMLPALVGDMRVMSTKRYQWRDIGPSRVAHGRLYGAQRATAWRPARRALRAAGCVALPVIAYGRLAARLARQPGMRLPLARATPLVLLAQTAWCLGEAMGYLVGVDEANDVF